MSLPIYSGHSAEALADDQPDYLAIIAGLPRGDNAYTGQPEVPVTFRIFTSMGDPDTRVTQAATHAERIAAVIDLFDDNNFTEVRSLLNKHSIYPFPDDRPWKGLGFTGWEPTGDPEDTHDNTRYIASLPYVFEVFKEDDVNINSSIQFALENALKSFISTEDIF
jgi:hypothetical protein